MGFFDWSTTADSNGTASGVNIEEGCPAGNVNNWGRTIMAQLRAAFNPVLATFFSASTLADARTALGVGSGSASQTAFGALTNEANKVPYMTGSDGWAKASLTSFARTLLDDGDGATFRTTLAALGLDNATFGTNTMDVRFTLPTGGTMAIVGGSGTLAGNSSATVSFGVTFSPAPVAIVNGGSTNISNEGDVHNAGAASTTGINIANSAPSSDGYTWLAIGKLA